MDFIKRLNAIQKDLDLEINKLEINKKDYYNQDTKRFKEYIKLERLHNNITKSIIKYNKGVK